MIESSVHLAKSRFDLPQISGWPRWSGLNSERAERSEQAKSELNEKDAKFESEASEAVAATRAKTFDQALGPQLGEVVAELAETVVGVCQTMPSQESSVNLARRPIGDKGAGVQPLLAGG